MMRAYVLPAAVVVAVVGPRIAAWLLLGRSDGTGEGEAPTPIPHVLGLQRVTTATQV